MKKLLIYLCCLLPLGLLGQNITYAEYFIDADPGEGSATSVPISTPDAVIDLNFTVNTATLTEGFHILFVRMQDENGKWSLVQMRPFYKPSAVNSTVVNITHAEYFIDTDPGEGSATSVPISTPNATQDLNFVANLNNVSSGFHILFVRIQDENGKWSLVQMRPFYKPEVVANQNTNIVAIEYAIDTDNGFGQNTVTPVSSPNTSVDINLIVDVSTLSLGDHYLFLRAQDENGK